MIPNGTNGQLIETTIPQTLSSAEDKRLSAQKRLLGLIPEFETAFQKPTINNQEVLQALTECPANGHSATYGTWLAQRMIDQLQRFSLPQPITAQNNQANVMTDVTLSAPTQNETKDEYDQRIRQFVDYTKNLSREQDDGYKLQRYYHFFKH